MFLFIATFLLFIHSSSSLTAEPGFRGVAAGRGVITCPPWATYKKRHV